MLEISLQYILVRALVLVVMWICDYIVTTQNNFFQIMTLFSNNPWIYYDIQIRQNALSPDAYNEMTRCAAWVWVAAFAHYFMMSLLCWMAAQGNNISYKKYNHKVARYWMTFLHDDRHVAVLDI